MLQAKEHLSKRRKATIMLTISSGITYVNQPPFEGCRLRDLFRVVRMDALGE